MTRDRRQGQSCMCHLKIWPRKVVLLGRSQPENVDVSDKLQNNPQTLRVEVVKPSQSTSLRYSSHRQALQSHKITFYFFFYFPVATHVWHHIKVLSADVFITPEKEGHFFPQEIFIVLNKSQNLELLIHRNTREVHILALLLPCSILTGKDKDWARLQAAQRFCSRTWCFQSKPRYLFKQREEVHPVSE